GDEAAIVDLAGNVDIQLIPAGSGGPIRVILDGEDVTEEIRAMGVSVNIKHVCKLAGVRENMVRMQREMASRMGGTVMEGRDVGTVVLKGARSKFYLDASFDERVERRLAELRAKGQPITRAEVADDLKQRDHTDKTREVGPLKKADDAELLDTTDLTIDQVVDMIVSKVKGK
ncbi:MAG: (d)CMP kinase, partial [Candidatus Omnitrophica bacterium]|nr:(d)CMP kinase [Candidatus Omnitrophota bacterium]